jgi:AraC-like DNA-binding protein
MDQKPWHQKEKLDPTFPCRIWETSMRTFTLHWHELVEIAYIRKGRMTVSVEGHSYEAKGGDIVFINSGAIHGYSGAEAGTSIIMTQFGMGLFDQSLVDLRDRAFQKLVFERKTFVTGDADAYIHTRLEALILDLRAEYAEQREGYRLAMKARLYDLALLLLRNVPARHVKENERRKRTLRNETLERIFTFVHDNFAKSISLGEAAEAAHLSKFYFTRFFRIQTGETFHAYLSRVRISRAAELLSDTDLPITDIAYQSGFASLQTFNRLFRTYTGVSPSNYRSGGRE